MKNSYRSKHVRVRVLNKLTQKGHPITIDYSNTAHDRYTVSSGIYLQEYPKSFTGRLTKQHAQNYKELQDKLDAKVEEVNTAIDSFTKTYGHKPTKQELVDQLRKPYEQPKRRLVKLQDIFEHVYQLKLVQVGKRSSENYKSLAFAVEDFSRKSGRNYTLEDIDQEFLKSFINYLLYFKPLDASVPLDATPTHKLTEGKGCKFDKRFGMSNNTLAKRMYTFVTVLKLYGTTTDTTISLDKIRLAVSSVKKLLGIYKYTYIKPTLTYEETELLASEKFTDFITHDKITEIIGGKKVIKAISKDLMVKARDILSLSIAGGSRFSDIVTMTERNLFEESKVARKTKEPYRVMNNPFVKELYEKYDYDFKISNQRYNKILRPLMKQFYEFYKLEGKDPSKQLFWKIEKRGNYTMEHKLAKWEVISSHTGRRSFATINCLEFGYSKEIVREYTGHSDNEMLDKYIQVSTDKNFDRITNTMNFKR